MKENFRILIVRLSAIGDTVHTLPLVELIKKRYPHAFIGWAVEDKASALVENHPLIDKVYVFPKSKWRKRGFSLQNYAEFWKVIFEIRKDKYDVAFDIQELLKSGVVSFLSGAKKRVAHKKAREHSDIFANDKLPYRSAKDENLHVVERNLEFLQKIDIAFDKEEIKFPLKPSSDEVKEHVQDLLKTLDKSKKTIVFSPATTWVTKHWKPQSWSELFNLFEDKFNIIITGTKNDESLVNTIIEGFNGGSYINLCGKTNIHEFVEVVYNADLVISPDSGSAHIAAACEKPVISLFGPTSYKRNEPFCGNEFFKEKNFSISANLACSPCFKKKCLKYETPAECMFQITPQKVHDIVKKLYY